jgi:3-dehydroquinate synthase
MIAESFIAKEMKLLDKNSYEHIVALICRIPLPANLSSLKMSDILNAIGRDKKHIGTKLRFVLPTKIGEVKTIDDVNPKLIKQAVKEILKKRK